MAQNSGTLVGAAIRPADSQDAFPSAFQQEIKGGSHSAADISARNAITTPRREWGMTCFVLDDGKEYRLCNLANGGADDDLANNSNWLEIAQFTTQEINSGGNYNNLEVTADLLVFTNENAQAILNGVWGKKEFHILNLSTQYDVRINHNSPSVTGNGVPIKLPTNEGNVGIKGTARILYTTAYGYFVADTWGSTYRPEFKGLAEEELLSVTPGSVASTRKIIQLRVFRDAQMTPMSKSELNTSYPDAVRGMEVICPELNLTYLKVKNSPVNDWVSISNTAVV